MARKHNIRSSVCFVMSRLQLCDNFMATLWQLYNNNFTTNDNLMTTSNYDNVKHHEVRSSARYKGALHHSIGHVTCHCHGSRTHACPPPPKKHALHIFVTHALHIFVYHTRAHTPTRQNAEAGACEHGKRDAVLAPRVCVQNHGDQGDDVANKHLWMFKCTFVHNAHVCSFLQWIYIYQYGDQGDDVANKHLWMFKCSIVHNAHVCSFSQWTSVSRYGLPGIETWE